MHAMDVMTGGKRVLASGFGEIGKGYTFALLGAGARVLTTESKPSCTPLACQEGFQVVTMEYVA
eukprot:10407420-Heterocapsa_arctica.AAC.1